MKKAIYLSVVSLSLFACGGGGSSGNSDAGTNPPTNSGNVSTKGNELSIVGSNLTATANSATKNKISISGHGNMIYIQTNTESLDIIGDSNKIDISNGVTIDNCTIVGNNNNAIKPSGMKVPCTVAGQNNTGFN